MFHFSITRSFSLFSFITKLILIKISSFCTLLDKNKKFISMSTLNKYVSF